MERVRFSFVIQAMGPTSAIFESTAIGLYFFFGGGGGGVINDRLEFGV